MATEGFARGSSRARFRHSRTRARRTLWCLRYRQQRRMGQCGHRPRHCGFRGQRHSKLVDELGVPITVCHLPPGTSKWNKIEHRLFSFITGNWRGKPLVSHQVIVQLIAATTTKTGLKVRCELDQNTYPAGIKVSDADIEAVNLTRHDFHGEWNYTVSPNALALKR